MDLNLAEKLKVLRKNKNISQEKLANFLGVSFQAISKWENGTTYPDISLLPNIARFYGITIDELLQVDKIDEKRLYDEYEDKAENLFRNGNRDEVMKLWQEAYKKMPNNIEVKEMLMSSYYDTNMIKYHNEIIELGNEIYNMDNPSNYYKGQVCNKLSVLYYNLGKKEMALKWANKSFSLNHATELIYTQISDNKEKIKNVSWCMYWFLDNMYWMAASLVFDDELSKDYKYKQQVFETVLNIYDIVYKNDDMNFEMMNLSYTMHKEIIKFEVYTTKNIEIIKQHLTRCKCQHEIDPPQQYEIDPLEHIKSLTIL